MTAWDAIRWIDDKKHNVYAAEDKLLWLRQAELMASELRGRCGLEPDLREPDAETALSVPAPFDRLYLHWLEAQIDYANQEYARYNNSIAMFNESWQEYANFLRRANAVRGMRKFF